MKSSSNRFKVGETVQIQKTGETVTVSNWQYVKHMKKYSYKVQEYPLTFYFEQELKQA